MLARAESAKNASLVTEPAENAPTEPAELTEPRAEAAEKEWVAGGDISRFNKAATRGQGNRELLPDLPLDL